METRYLCNLVIPGAAKSGTSSLHDILDRHPEISMSTPKEPQHFSFSDRYARGPEHHNALFEPTGSTKFYGESSQCYMVHEHALERIRNDLISPKAILLLRHPIERLLSHYRWNYKLGVEKKPLMVALEQRGEDVSYAPDMQVGMYRERGGYFAFSRYSRWVPLWRNALGDENVLLLRTEELRADQDQLAQRCFHFLGLDQHRVVEPLNKNTTEETLKIVPRPLSIAALAVPSSLKKSTGYRRMVRFVRVALTKTPPSSLTEMEREFLMSALAEDISFYEEFAATFN